MQKENVKFMFIDEQGHLNGREKWLLRGGCLVGVREYLSLSTSIGKLNYKTFNTSSEIKWNEISRAIYCKQNNKKLSEDILRFAGYEISQLEAYLVEYFKILSNSEIKIIVNISNDEVVSKHIKYQDSFIKMQLQNLMQRCQFEGQGEDFVTILVHDNENTSADDKLKKEVYKEILESDTYVKDYSLIVDNLFIEFSHMNIGIQIADFIIGAISGRLRKYERSESIFNNYLKSKIRRNQKDSNAIGYGIVLIPTPQKEPEFAKQMEAIFN